MKSPVFCKAVVFWLFLPMLSLFSGCEGKSGADSTSLRTVTYKRIATACIPQTRDLPGRTTAYVVSDVRPQVSGIIQKRYFTEGAHVQKGEALYQIDPALYQTALDSAKASLKEAEARELGAKFLEERYAQLVKINAVSRQEYDDARVALLQAQAQIASAKASLETARINLNYTRITAPVSGFIGRSFVTPGALVTQNQEMPLATVQQLDPIYVDNTRPSLELLRLKQDLETGKLASAGKEALDVLLELEKGRFFSEISPKSDPLTGEIVKDADGTPVYEETPVKGVFKFSEVTVEPSTDVVTMRALFPNPEGKLLPGLYVRALIEEGIRKNAILIPQKTASRDAMGTASVNILVPLQNTGTEEQYRVESRIVTIDRPMGNEWLVLDGLEEGDLLLVEGGIHVRPGQTVKGIPEPEKMVQKLEEEK